VGEGAAGGIRFGGFATGGVALVCVGGISSSRGRITDGLGTPFGFGGATFWLALLTSVRSASNSRSSCLSYIIDERACSIKAAVISSATVRLCVSIAR
jgi:hypothetical protein